MNPNDKVARTPIHTRRVECVGYRRSDGLWGIEGHLLDTRSDDITFYDGRTLKAGEALHEMRLCITLDREFVIRAAEAVTLHSPYLACPEIAPAYQQLVGLRIGPGFTLKLREASHTDRQHPCSTSGRTLAPAGRQHRPQALWRG